MNETIFANAAGRIFIGIDDTDNLDSRGTGFRVRDLGNRLEGQKICAVESVTRHQLLVDERIPYTSHNSSACMTVLVIEKNLPELSEFCQGYLLTESAVGSDAGLCVISEREVPDEVREWGRRAKREVLQREECRILAGRHGIFLQGLTGDHGGVIGALAAVGLRSEGGDGRFIGLRGIRELDPGVYSVSDLCKSTGIDEVRDLQGVALTPGTAVEVDDWVRPVLLNGRAVLLAEKNDDKKTSAWRIADKSITKRH